MLGPLLPFLSVLRNLSAVRTGLQVLFMGGILKQWKKNEDNERSQRLGTNLFVEDEKVKMLAKELREAGMPVSDREAAKFRSSAFSELEYFILDGKSLPPELDLFVGEWCLTPKEKAALRDAIRKKGLELRVGDEAEELKRLCERTGLSFEELDFLWKLEELPVDIEALAIISKERLKDPDIRRSFGLNVKQ